MLFSALELRELWIRLKSWGGPESVGYFCHCRQLQYLSVTLTLIKQKNMFLRKSPKKTDLWFIPPNWSGVWSSAPCVSACECWVVWYCAHVCRSYFCSLCGIQKAQFLFDLTTHPPTPVCDKVLPYRPVGRHWRQRLSWTPRSHDTDNS